MPVTKLERVHMALLFLATLICTFNPFSSLVKKMSEGASAHLMIGMTVTLTTVCRGDIANSEA